MQIPQTADVIHWAGNGASLPANWLLCNGAAVSRTTYAALFTAIGTTFGAGDGSTTFNLPGSGNAYLRGASTAGGTGGSVNHVHTGAPHSHAVTQASDHSAHTTAGGHTHDAHTTASRGTTVPSQTPQVAPLTHSTDGSHTHTGAHSHSGAASASATPADTGSGEPPFLALHVLIRI